MTPEMGKERRKLVKRERDLMVRDENFKEESPFIRSFYCPDSNNNRNDLYEPHTQSSFNDEKSHKIHILD
jgi:hypothetical protein